MKTLLHAIFATIALASTLSAQVIYSGPQDLNVGATDLEGIYINIETGSVVSVFPVDFDDGPWINITLGGYGIFNGAGVRPIATSSGPSYDPDLSSDYYVNVPEGTLIDDTSAFVVDGFASVNHVGTDPGMFVPGEPGILGFEFTKTADSSIHYGWLRFEVGADGGPGVIVDWAYENTAGTAIQAGAVPEPSTLGLIAVAALGGAVFGRRRGRSLEG